MVEIYRELIPETVVPGRPLGRHVAHDPRSRDFQAERATKLVSVLHNATGLPLDQDKPKPIGSCTANAFCGAANCEPNLKGGTPKTEDDARTLYGLETKNEGQPWPPNDPGGTGLAVCKAAKQLGWCKSFSNAFGIQHALEALVLTPVITGVAWMSSFDTPDSNGLVGIARGSTVRGGHEFLVDEIILEHALVGCWNSWGDQFGVGGKFYMSFATWDHLLRQRGDVTVPVF